MEVESVLVTGSNRGLGLQFIKQFCELDSPPKHIFAACRDPEKAEELQLLKNEHKAKTSVHLVKLEITDEVQITSSVEYVKSVVGEQGLTLLINNAGIMPHTNFPNITGEQYLEIFKVDVIAPMLTTQAYIPLLKASASRLGGSGESLSVSQGAILNIAAGIAAFDMVNFNIWCKIDTYRMAKAAFHMGSAIQARELRSSGIMVLTVHPGWVSTDLGGPMAPLTPEGSVKAMMGVLATAGSEQHGAFIDQDGKSLSW